MFNVFINDIICSFLTVIVIFTIMLMTNAFRIQVIQLKPFEISWQMTLMSLWTGFNNILWRHIPKNILCMSHHISVILVSICAQIYGKGQDRLEIIAPFVKSQVGGNDCGAFAIANLVEFCMGNFWRDENSLSCRGDLCQDTLRSHLVTCFEKKRFSEFMARASYGRKSYKSYFIDTSCCCGLPDEYDNMIACNGCEGWFHQVCAGVNESSLPDSWGCWECVEKGDNVIGRSPRDI